MPVREAPGRSAPHVSSPSAPRRHPADVADTLEQRFADGDDRALEEAFARWGGLVFHLCRRLLPNVTDAEDATQQTFVEAWRSRRRFDPDRGSLAGWLLGIARHRSLDGLRALERTPQPVEPGSAEPTAEPSRKEEADEVLEHLLLVDALDTLPERQRQVLTLAFFEDATQQAIAERLTLPLGTVKSDVRRGLQSLRSALG